MHDGVNMSEKSADVRRGDDRDNILECIVIGAGPAGLTAGIYLQRFLRRCLVFDAGSGRAATIPRSHNLPGFPGGLSGVELLARLETQLQEFGGHVIRAEVDSIALSDERFAVFCEGVAYRSRSVVLATGVVNHKPNMPEAMHVIGVSQGLIRYCPVSDGYEARRSSIAVLGADEHGAAEALFLRSYGAAVTLLVQHSLDLPADDLQALARAGIDVVEEPIEHFQLAATAIEVSWRSGRRQSFGTLYPALGSTSRTKLAVQLGAKLSDQGSLVTDKHQRTSIPGFYAIGDVVEGLGQICVATGQAAIAATAIHNDLLERGR